MRNWHEQIQTLWHCQKEVVNKEKQLKLKSQNFQNTYQKDKKWQENQFRFGQENLLKKKSALKRTGKEFVLPQKFQKE